MYSVPISFFKLLIVFCISHFVSISKKECKCAKNTHESAEQKQVVEECRRKRKIKKKNYKMMS